MSQHTIEAQWEQKFRVPGLEDFESTMIKAAVRYEYSPAYTPRIPPGEYAPIDPPVDAEVTFIDAVLIDGGDIDPTPTDLQNWADDWLNGDGYEEAVEHAAANQGPDPDRAYEQKRDDAWQFPHVEDDYD